MSDELFETPVKEGEHVTQESRNKTKRENVSLYCMTNYKKCALCLSKRQRKMFARINGSNGSLLQRISALLFHARAIVLCSPKSGRQIGRQMWQFVGRSIFLMYMKGNFSSEQNLSVGPADGQRAIMLIELIWVRIVLQEKR